jgi:hypothetical protein
MLFNLIILKQFHDRVHYGKPESDSGTEVGNVPDGSIPECPSLHLLQLWAPSPISNYPSAI